MSCILIMWRNEWLLKDWYLRWSVSCRCEEKLVEHILNTGKMKMRNGMGHCDVDTPGAARSTTFKYFFFCLYDTGQLEWLRGNMEGIGNDVHQMMLSSRLVWQGLKPLYMGCLLSIHPKQNKTKQKQNHLSVI